MRKQLTRLSLVWKTVGGVAKPFFNETQGKPCGGRRPSGLGQPTGKSAGPGQDPLQDGRPHPEPSGGGVRQHLDLLQQSPQQHRGRRRHRLDMGPAEKRRYPGDVKAPGDKKEDVFYFYFLYSVCGLVVSRGECRSRYVLFLVETSKLWTVIYCALVGWSARPRLEPLQAIGTSRALPRSPSTRLGCHAYCI